MTRAEKEYIFENADKVSIAPSEPLNLYEMKAYIKGFEDARNNIFDCIDECYRNMKTD